jgi:hypothetical protein
MKNEDTFGFDLGWKSVRDWGGMAGLEIWRRMNF